MIYKDESSLEKTDLIENYYGFENGISGKDLYKTGIKQAQNLGIDVKNEEVIKIEMLDKSTFSIKTVENEYTSKVVILATGNKKNTPNLSRAQLKCRNK